MTLKPRKIISTPLLRPPVSLKNHSIRFTNDTDTLTDVAVPYKNRQTSKRRINVHEGKSFSEQFGSVGATTVLPLVKQSFREDLRSFLQSTSDEIYEDVLQNQQEALFGNNNAVAPETDFDDLSIFERTQHNTDKIPIPSVFDPAHPHPVSRVDSTATREDVSLSLPSGDPLDAPILLRPLTNDVVELGRLHREQVRQKVVDDTSESFAVDKNEIIKEKPIDAFISRTTHFADSIPIRIVDEWSTMTYASSSTPIPSELKTITMQVDEAATIIPTLENTPWTAPPSENSFRSDTIPLAQNVAIDGPLIVVNKVDGSTSSIQNNESNWEVRLRSSSLVAAIIPHLTAADMFDLTQISQSLGRL
uniref:F-box domain-containing protein n=1 Tax=Angiostrongylus cantonensis TaxID=6313 RepID=A0A0K0DPU2_ANGCA